MHPQDVAKRIGFLGSSPRREVPAIGGIGAEHASSSACASSHAMRRAEADVEGPVMPRMQLLPVHRRRMTLVSPAVFTSVFSIACITMCLMVPMYDHSGCMDMTPVANEKKRCSIDSWRWINLVKKKFSVRIIGSWRSLPKVDPVGALCCDVDALPDIAESRWNAGNSRVNRHDRWLDSMRGRGMRCDPVLVSFETMMSTTWKFFDLHSHSTRFPSLSW